MPDLRTVLASMEPHDGGYAIEAFADWGQGRTLYGGMTTAICAHAAKQAVPDLPPLRSADIAFVGPASETLHLSVELLRQGRSATLIGVDCRNEKGTVARATLIHGTARDSAIRQPHVQAMPEIPKPDDCPSFAEGGLAPDFFAHFEVRLAEGHRPFSGVGEPWFSVWVRHRNDDGVDPETAFIALADCPPPAASVLMKGRAPTSSMNWSTQLVGPVMERGWFLLRSKSEQAADGYSLQTMDAWTEDGRHAAIGRQLVAVFA